MVSVKRVVWLGASALGSAAVASAQINTKPNFVFIMTDDQDLHLNSLDYMPFHLAVLLESLSSLGKLPNVTEVSLPYGGYQQFINNGLYEKYLPVWLEQAVYGTYYTSKLMDGFSSTTYNSPYPARRNDTDYECNSLDLYIIFENPYDQFYLEQQIKVSFSECIGGQVLQYEGPHKPLAYGGVDSRELVKNWEWWMVDLTHLNQYHAFSRDASAVSHDSIIAITFRIRAPWSTEVSIIGDDPSPLCNHAISPRAGSI